MEEDQHSRRDSLDSREGEEVLVQAILSVLLHRDVPDQETTAYNGWDKSKDIGAGT